MAIPQSFIQELLARADVQANNRNDRNRRTARTDAVTRKEIVDEFGNVHGVII